MQWLSAVTNFRPRRVFPLFLPETRRNQGSKADFSRFGCPSPFSPVLSQRILRHNASEVKPSSIEFLNFEYYNIVSMTDYREYITIDAGKRSGKACVRGMRITVADVLGYLAAGMSHDEIVSDFPELTNNDILACLAYAADAEKKYIIAAA
jgi:uncharacterized protein (DUF433 family)